VGVLRAALRQLETYWLGGAARFLGGTDRPSIADLVLAAELVQLQLLPRGEGAALLAGAPRVRAWLQALEEAAAPHWANANTRMHAALAAAHAPKAAL